MRDRPRDEPVAADDRTPLRLGPHARTVLEKRYLARDAAGAIAETPRALLWRVARAVGEVDAVTGPEPFFALMASGRFFPNSPALRAGVPQAQLAACYVLPVEDSLPSIYDSLRDAALVQRAGGGTGFDFSELRPSGEDTRGVNPAGGPVGFIELFDASSRQLAPDSLRPGANMAVLRADHPDILAFVRVKSDPARLTHFNLSVAAPEAFLRAVDEDGPWALRDPRTGEVTDTLRARLLFDAICASAWRSGEPGLLFVDRIAAADPVPHLGPIRATNPCGEQPLLPYESCVLGSLHLAAFVRDGALDTAALAEAARLGTRFLDAMIDASSYAVERIAATTRKTRRLGLGVMGLADALAAVGEAYDSEAALHLAGEWMAAVRFAAREASEALAVERGPFPAWPGSRPERAGEPPRRNAALTTIAPTGTLSLLAGCSAGIEPFYALRFERFVLGGLRLPEVPAGLEAALAEAGLDPLATLDRAVAAGSLAAVDGVPDSLARRWRTAHEIAPEWHVRMQAAFQAHTDGAVSKTVNLPAEAPVEAVAEAYRLAWALGCKGVTVYRDRTRGGQVLGVGAG